MNKRHISGILAFFILIFCIYVYKDANFVLEKPTDKPYVEQIKTTTVGYDQGIKVFEISINRILQGNYQHVLFAKNITGGTVFNDKGYPVIRQLKGNSGRINTNIKSMVVTDNISALIEPTTSTQSITVNAGKFKYNHQQKTAKFNHDTKLSVKKVRIYSDQLSYSNNDESLSFNHGLTLIDNHSQTTADNARLDIPKSILIATKNIATTYTKKESNHDSDQIKALLKYPTIISSQKLFINFNDTEHAIATYHQNVLAKQTGKTLSCDELALNFKQDQYTASGNIELTFEHLNWLLNKKRIIKNKDIQSLLKKKTTITADNGTFSPSNNMLVLNNNVTLKQTNLKLQSDQLKYDIDNESITLIGQVIVKKYGLEHLNANKLIVDIKNETFRTDSRKELSEIILELND
jgi:lipopolysaccharide export system protein LptA